MKTDITEKLETDIRKTTTKNGVFGCAEVTIGFGGNERVDYMTCDTKGVFRCYEIKSSKSDFYSEAKKSFVGHYNYYVLTKDLYEQVKDDVPNEIGVYIGQSCIKKGKKCNLVVSPDVLKDSMIRSLYRDSEKLYKTNDEQYLGRLKKEIEELRSENRSQNKRFNALYFGVSQRYGHGVARELVDAD